jgi:SAM-dependent methyltransferase
MEEPVVRTVPDASQWAAVASQAAPSWYLDPLVGRQKREVHQRFLRDCARGLAPRTVLKTDVFEEAFGPDQILFDLQPEARLTVGMDIAREAAAGAAGRAPGSGFSFLVADVRRLPFRAGAFDLVISTSTLDHFAVRRDLDVALEELVRVVRPGGRLAITLDNPWNPMLFPLRAWSHTRWGPFPLGHTMSLAKLTRGLEARGMQVLATDWLIHNPRLVSTLMFLALRRLLGARADPPIRGLLRFFGLFAHSPARWMTACFVAACARKPEAGEHAI